MWPTVLTRWLAPSRKPMRTAALRRRPAFRQPLTRRPRSSRPRVELLEDRLAPAILTVNSTADTVSGTTPTLDLREAILLTNSGGTATDSMGNSLAAAKATQIDTSSGGFGTNDTIQFAIPTTDPGYTAATSVSITNVSLAANVATLTTSAQVPVAVGQTVIVAGLANSFFDGNYQVTAETATSFSYTLVHANVASTIDSGTASDPSRFTIMPQAVLPKLLVPVTIKGFSQPGACPNTLPAVGLNSGDNAVRLIILDGTQLHISSVLGTFDSIAAGGAAADKAAPVGLVVAGGNTSVSGLMIQNFSSTFWFYAPGVVIGPVHDGTGIHLTSSGNTIAGNYLTNTPSNGMFIDNVPNNTIGGTVPAARNVLADESSVSIQGTASTANVVQGNYIGTDGIQLLQSGSRVTITDASSNIIGGTVPGAGNVVAGDLGFGIGVLSSSQSADDNLIQGNYIGVDSQGKASLYPSLFANFAGIIVSGNAQNNIIGGPPLAARNLIEPASGSYGIELSAFPTGPSSSPSADSALISHNTIQGNYIGVNASGTALLSNPAFLPGDGIDVDGSDNLVLGNVISGASNGLDIGLGFGGQLGEFAPAVGNVVQGNLIGTVGAGNTGEGVWITAGIDNTIGGTNPGQANVITQNGLSGIAVQTDWSGSTSSTTGNLIEGNSVYGNTYLGIDLTANWPTPDMPNLNSANDAAGHAGPNNYQNFPVLNSATSSSTDTLITGTFSSGSLNGQPFEPCQAITLDFYANPSPDASGYGQGQTYLGFATVTTDVYGYLASASSPYGSAVINNPDTAYATFTADLTVGSLAGQWISATATDQAGTNGTSEFSPDAPVLAPGEMFADFLPGALPQSPTSVNSLTIVASPGLTEDTVIGAVNQLTAAIANGTLPPLAYPVTVTLNLNGGTYNDTTVDPPHNMTLVINGASGTNTFVGQSPALTVSGGTVIVKNVSFTTATNAPTILVTGGSLTLRNDVVQESTGFADPAISVTGGTVDLGTAASPGNNSINVNGAGAFAQNTTATPIAAVGDAFTVNGQPLTPSSLSGVVWEDFNGDGQVDFGEQGIAGVQVTLAGTDDLGNAVSQSQLTDGDGAYVFLNLRPGNYYLTETQPAGYPQGVDSVGTAGGSLAAADQFFVQLGVEVDGLNYNYGEQPPTTGAVQKGQAAGIGFWNNKNGQALIKSFNGGAGTQLADWLAATLPHIFGIDAGANDLAGKSNAFVAALFQSDFVVKGTKLDAQVLATALSVYATSATLDSTGVAAQYGFTVSGDGLGTDTWNVGSDGDAFGVANNTSMTVMDLLLAADAQAVSGVLYNGNSAKRKEANDVFSALNQAGGI